MHKAPDQNKRFILQFNERESIGINSLVDCITACIIAPYPSALAMSQDSKNPNF